MPASSKNPQIVLHQALATGQIKRAEKALAAGAILKWTEATTSAEDQMLARERKELWKATLLGRSSKAVEWLLAQDPTFDAPDYFSKDNFKDWVHVGQMGLGDWMAETFLPKVEPHLDSVAWQSLWKTAVNRSSNEMLAWMLDHGAPDHGLDLWSYSLLHSSWWQVAPEGLAERCALLVKHGHRWETPDLAVPTMETWLRRYRVWQEGENGKPAIRQAYDTFSPQIWDAFLAAGADPNLPDAQGKPLVRHIEGLGLERYLKSREREAQLAAVVPAPLSSVSGEGPSPRRFRS